MPPPLIGPKSFSNIMRRDVETECRPHDKFARDNKYHSLLDFFLLGLFEILVIIAIIHHNNI